MKKEIAEKWVATLRSGEIQQTTGALGKADGKRCCLGVLCDIAVEDGVIGEPEEYGEWEEYGQWMNYAGEGNVLPKAVQVWAGMRTPNGMYEETADGVCLLSQDNDAGNTFTQIAYTIEKYAEEL